MGGPLDENFEGHRPSRDSRLDVRSPLGYRAIPATRTFEIIRRWRLTVITSLLRVQY